MKNVIGAIAVGALMGLVAGMALSTPVVQVSHRTKAVVACATEDTKWEMTSVADHPACKDIKQAEVEWVE